MRVFRPTRKQKKLLKEHRLNPNNWYITTRQQPDVLRVIHNETKTVREIAMKGEK